ncbi:MAG: SDR family NAD(P)-dependent oxidoreductase [Anaerolineales bacterium]|nr:SDR family NAD(P)-dependent oxidoreductase [Anaerolineales bacterium]
MTERRFALITGGNRGMGYATAVKLAQRGLQVVIATRDERRGTQAAEALKRAVPGAAAEALALDLSSFASIRAAAAEYQRRGYPLQVLLNNAGLGTYPPPVRFTADGHELIFGTNHLGHFLFAYLLRDVLKRSAPARVVVVSSRRHIPDYAGGQPVDFDFDNLRGEKYFKAATCYCNSQLANVWFAYELQRRLAGTGVTVDAVCPGFVPATIAENRAGLERFFYRAIMSRMPFANTVERAAEMYAQVATEPKWAAGGQFIADFRAIQSSPESYDAAKARCLWDESLRWCGLAADAVTSATPSAAV